MKALSLWQPWASAIATGAKRIETRSWPTSYRGPLAIHAAKRCVKSELVELDTDPNWAAALRWNPKIERLPWERLPFGAIVCVAELVDCRPTGSFSMEELHTRRTHPGAEGLGWWVEAMLGDFYPGRWGWVLEDVRTLPDPIPFRGERGLFEVPAELVA